MEPGTMERMVALTKSSSNESYVEPSPYAWLRSRAPVPTTYAPACEPLYPFQDVLENRTSRARCMTVSCTEVVERKFSSCIEIWQVELEDGVWRVSFHKYAYVHGDPIQGTDPTGEFAANGMGEFFWTLTMGPPGIGDSIQGALQSLVTAYAINLEWDVKWALDWNLADDLNTRQDDSWVTEALIQGAISPWEEFLKGLDFSRDDFGPILAGMGRPGGVGPRGPLRGMRLGASVKFEIGTTSVHAVSIGKNKGFVFDAPKLGKPISFQGDNRIPADVRLPARAKALRERNGMLGIDDLAERNVASAKIEVKGQEGFIDQVNVRGGPHSEELLMERIRQLKRRFGDQNVTVKEVFTERIPCTNAGCRRDLNDVAPNARVSFFSRQHGDDAASDLIEAYRL